MTATSPTFSSDPPAPSRSFELLAEPVRRWVWRQDWQELRDIQERSIPLLLDGDADVIIAAATAGGKTEAAFLPLISRVLRSAAEGPGFDLLYVSPLRALINDQFRRLQELCAAIDLPVHPWHGDVAAAVKAKARKNPRGILLITPESLEAAFVRRGLEIPGLFRNLDCVVIDELHALLDTERGVQVRSLLSRLEAATGRRIRRVGLSATLGDAKLTRHYLRPEDAAAVAVLESGAEGPALRAQLRGYRVGRSSAGEGESERSSTAAIAAHLFERLRGATNLMFAGSRQNVEQFADLLRRNSERLRLPNEFFPHHSNLSRDHRMFVEQRLKEGRLPTTAVCTSTLELGIDIGEIACVAQVGAPFSVASLRQRLGRSGRRGQPAILRMYDTERGLDAELHPVDALRLGLVRSIAMLDLLLERWCERPRPAALHLSTLVHQVLSVIAERGGETAERLFLVLCQRGPFKRVDPALFARLLRRLGEPDVALIEQSPDGTLLLGRVGERIIEHYSFYAVFQTPDEYRVLFNTRTLGTIPLVTPLAPGMTIIFAGRRWRVRAIHDRERVIEVTRDATGRPPPFAGEAGVIDDAVIRRMRAALEGDEVPRYLDAAAAELLREGRGAYRRLDLSRRRIVDLGHNHYLVATWEGSIRTATLALALRLHGCNVTVHDAFLEVSGMQDGAAGLTGALESLAHDDPPTGRELAAGMASLHSEKFHRYLSRDLLIADAAAGRIDAAAVPLMAKEILEGAA